jgi:hypothetical protein
MGSSHGETEPKKATLAWGRAQQQTLTDWSLFPPSYVEDSGKSHGDSVVEGATPKGTK